ncbi:MAG: DUF2029 domain-containing protein [Chloroflexi bacterium]|nr:DUF2029 domain-containing protein [Chloroflexota bacterium]
MDRPRPVQVLAVLTLLLLIALSWLQTWSMPGGTSLFLGLDLRAYSAGAERLIVSGSPYHSDLSIGPIANRLENVEIAYVYTPALAQLFTLILAVPEDLFALAWAYTQVLAMSIAIPLMYRWGGGQQNTTSVALLLIFTVATSAPVQFAALVGNVSGFVGIAVAAALMWPRLGLVALPSLALVKMTPALLLLPWIAAPNRHRSLLLTVLALGLAASAFVFSRAGCMDCLDSGAPEHHPVPARRGE